MLVLYGVCVDWPNRMCEVLSCPEHKSAVNGTDSVTRHCWGPSPILKSKSLSLIYHKTKIYWTHNSKHRPKSSQGLCSVKLDKAFETRTQVGQIRCFLRGTGPEAIPLTLSLYLLMVWKALSHKRSRLEICLSVY